MWTVNFQLFKLDLEKAEEPEINLPTSDGSSKKQESPKKIYFFFTDYAKAFDYVYHNKQWKIMKEMGIQITLPDSWEAHMQVKKQQLELDMEWQACPWNDMVSNRERSKSRLYIVTLLI